MNNLENENSENNLEIYLGIVKNSLPYIENNSSIIYSQKVSKINSQYKNNNTNNTYIDPLLKTPSEHILPLTQTEESQLRFFCTTLISDSCIVLKLPQMTILTAQNIFNRFYYIVDYISFEPFHVICASISLATKSEETFRRIRDIISCVYYIYKRREHEEENEKNEKKNSKNVNKNKYKTDTSTIPQDLNENFILDVSSIFYEKLKQNVMSIEAYILKHFGFNLYSLTDHPHKYVLHFIKNLKGTRDLLQRSWNYLNDAYKSSLCVNYPPYVLACSSIFLAGRVFYFPLPNLSWWEAYETNIEEIQEVCAEMLRIQEMRNVGIGYVRRILRKFSPFKDEIENFEKMKNLDNLRKSEDVKEKRRERYDYSKTSRSREKRRKYSRSRSRSRDRDRRRDDRKKSKNSKKNKKEKKYKSRKRSKSRSSSYSYSSRSYSHS
jgi:hypothetical protein